MSKQNIEIRGYNRNDFEAVSQWWNAHHGNVFCEGYVPPCAYMVTYDGIPMSFFGMCPMTPEICYFAFPLVNPGADRETRNEVIDAMIGFAQLWAVNTRHKIVYISLKGEKMLSRLEKAGFTRGEEGNTHMFCKMENES